MFLWTSCNLIDDLVRIARKTTKRSLEKILGKDRGACRQMCEYAIINNRTVKCVERDTVYIPDGHRYGSA